MPDIHVLSPLLANQIAAGEVVERPASVVKELVENSIDAGSSCISVTITDGGISSIIVSDNGCGIAKDQCTDAFLRHATSKITTVDDLAAIDSLGFRGEALASISAVASVTLTTRTPGNDTGRIVCVDAGNILFAKDIACTQGTVIKVENLFSKTPARLRFLKSPRFEAGHCADYISRMILSHPEISFRYVQDGKTVYESYGDNNLRNTVYSVYGKHIYSHLLPIDFDDGYLKIDGFIGTQEVSHANRNMESFFVNGRYIRSASLSNALENAFLTRIMIGRYPFALIRITISPKEIDVNVHPSKTQIKFANETRVCEALTKACSSSLKPVIIPQIAVQSPSPVNTVEKTSSVSCIEDKNVTFQYPKCHTDLQSSNRDLQNTVTPQTNTGVHYYSSISKQKSESVLNEYRDHPAAYTYNDFKAKTDVSGTTPVYTITSKVPGNTTPNSTPIQDSLPISKEYTLIGCAFNAYWVIEFDNDLYLIDQHAACERKLYEKIMAEEQGSASQTLLLPQLITLPPDDFESAEQHRESLEKIGYRFEKADTLTYSVSAVPFINGKLFDSSDLCNAVKIIESTGKAASKEMIYESLVSSSCKHSIKAGERITKEEMIALIDQFIDNSIPLTCPHGRPVIIKLSRQEIEKGFKRIV